jgi:outer membrane protein assembly factor BamB
MQKRTLSMTTILLTGCWLAVQAADWPQWRGPQRTGISPETGLLSQWPAEGPKLMWKITGIGDGFSTPAIVGERIYLLSNEGLEAEFVRAFGVQDGRLLWSTKIGKVGKPDQQPNYPGARSTPTVDNDRIFAFGSDGDLAALDAKSGKIHWQKNVRELGGESGKWAYAESPLVDGDAVVIAPGGGASMAAFDKRTGAVKWTAAVPDGGTAAYSSIAVVEIGGVRQYVAVLHNAVIGVDSKSGKVLWTDTRLNKGCQGAFPTPIFSSPYLYTACNATGGALLRLSVQDGTVTAEPVYHQKGLPGEKGGSVLVDGHLYGTNSQALFCTELSTGTVKWKERGVGVASIAYADGRLYVRGESGEVALVEPSPSGYREISRFTPPGSPERVARGKQPPIGAWPHPVIANGRLYLRDVGTLWSYDIHSPRETH